MLRKAKGKGSKEMMMRKGMKDKKPMKEKMKKGGKK
jgi:hypothetical protein